MRIGELAQRSGLSIDTVRFYEKQGLLGAAHVRRSANGYRLYTTHALERLVMIRQAQGAGFTLHEICALLALWDRDALPDTQIVAHLEEKRQQIAARIAELQQMEHYLAEKIRQYLGVAVP